MVDSWQSPGARSTYPSLRRAGWSAREVEAASCSSVSYMPCCPRPIAWPTTPAKSGLNHMARTMAAELVAHSIRVNIIKPGWIDTPGERNKRRKRNFSKPDERCPWAGWAAFGRLHAAPRTLCSDDLAYVTGTSNELTAAICCPGLGRTIARIRPPLIVELYVPNRVQLIRAQRCLRRIGDTTGQFFGARCSRQNTLRRYPV